MNIWKTSLVLACLFAAGHLHAQFQKGDWLLEGGFRTHLEGSLGKKDIDLSQESFGYFETDAIGWNASVGKFFRENKEWGLCAEETWERRKGEIYHLTQPQEVVRATKGFTYDFSAGLYFRRYYGFGKGWHGGFRAKCTGGKGWYAFYKENAGVEELVEGHYHEHLGVTGNLFVSKIFGKHFGGRVSFGEMGYSLHRYSYARGVIYSKFDFNLRNLINPDISILWTFHGKSKKHRD